MPRRSSDPLLDKIDALATSGMILLFIVSVVVALLG